MSSDQKMVTSISPSPHVPIPPISSSRPFLCLPDVIRERIYFFVLSIDVEPRKPWITPQPSTKMIPRHLPGLPSEPDCNLESVSKSVRKKRRRRMRAFMSAKAEAIVAARVTAPASCLAILATCRTILLEAFHLWYKNNTLNFFQVRDLCDFLASIGRVRANEIRSLRLDLPAREWDDPKARFLLGSLLRLERLIFVYNDWGPSNTNPKKIPYPKIISHLRGLREVVFSDPEHPLTFAWGWKQGMTECVKTRMEELRGNMVTKRKNHRPEPPMVDLFNRLNIVNQKKKGTTAGEWEDGLSYAPDIAGDEVYSG
ncbi:MAG: hypothetical protein Q9219_001439 [cf. Caloplaca sp. 3 TL-2023]